MKTCSAYLTIVLLWCVNTVTSASTIAVGPSRQYTSLQQVAGFLAPGDTVLVDGNATYAGGVVFNRAGTVAERILIRGVPINGSRPVISGGTNGVAFIDGADHYTFENFEVRDATFRGIYHQSNDLIIRNVLVHHCVNGLMGADNGSGSLLLEHSEFHNCGSGTQAHQIYMATDEGTNPGSVFRMQFCYIHDGTGGNNVKSRSERNEIYFNWIEGAVYHELELIGPDPAGGVPAGLKREDSDVVGNVLWKKSTPSGGQANFYVVRFGGDGTGETVGRYRFVNNTVVMGTSAVFRLFDSLESVEIHNNVFHRPVGGAAPLVRTVEALWSSGEAIAGQNNWIHSDITSVPLQLTGSVRGMDPMVVEFTGNNLKPASGSPLVDGGTATPEPPPGFTFPFPLFPPAFEPPSGTIVPPGAANVRPDDGKIDIGAFEREPETDVTSWLGVPDGVELEANYPNPFNPTTRIRYHLEEAGDVKLAVCDVLGRETRVLVKEWKLSGSHEVTFDASDLPSGVYMYRLTSGHSVLSRKMLLLK